MKRILEQYPVQWITALLLASIIAFTEMRINQAHILSTLTDTVNVLKAVQGEQLLRSDEIEWVQQQRNRYEQHHNPTK